MRPFRSRELLGREVRAGLHKSLVIKGNTSIEPARVGVRPGHHEHVADVVRLDVAGSLVAPPDPLEPSVPFQANNLGTGPQHDRWRLFDPANEIAGHGVRQSIFPDQHVDAACGLREKHRGLSGRIAAAHDHNLVTETELGFHGRGAVVDTGAFEHRQVLERRFPVLRSSRDDDRTCED